MQKLDNLKIYKSSYDLHLQLFISTKNINREYKYSIVQDMKKRSFKLLLNIYKANYEKEKRVKYLNKAKKDLEYIRLSLRILKDLKVLNIKKFVSLNTLIEDVSFQIYSWKKSL